MARSTRRGFTTALAAAALIGSATVHGQAPVSLGATTSTENSGLLGHLLPRFEADTGIPVRVIVQGTGAILRAAAAGDLDVVLVHDPAGEEAFIAAGNGRDRRPVMHNDFLIVGPADDPASIKELDDAAAALGQIAAAEALFASRGDQSGTHQAERRLWRQSDAATQPEGRWYRETGSGQGANLNIAAALGAYALTDRGTWLSFSNRGDLEELVSGDPRLRNLYSVILVEPAKHPHVNAGGARQLADWLTGPAGQLAIAEFRINGEMPFFAHGLSQP